MRCGVYVGMCMWGGVCGCRCVYVGMCMWGGVCGCRCVYVGMCMWGGVCGCRCVYVGVGVGDTGLKSWNFYYWTFTLLFLPLTRNNP